MATFNLSKGEKFSFTKGLRTVRLTLSWDAPEKIGGVKYDPDASLFGLVYRNGEPKFFDNGNYAICYANTGAKQKDGTLASPDGAIVHSGDARGGGTETILVHLEKIASGAEELAAWVTIFQGDPGKPKHNHTFGMMSNAQIEVFNDDSGESLCVYKLGSEFANAWAVQVGGLTQDGGNWAFTAVGAGAQVELGDIIEKYN